MPDSPDRGGVLGTGSTLLTGLLSEGVHRLTLTATDSDGNKVTASVTATITAPDMGCGGATNRCFIEQAYRDVLGRQAEDGGLEFWSGRLDQEASRIQVAQAIAGSLESYTLQVQDLYRSYLWAGRQTRWG